MQATWEIQRAVEYHCERKQTAMRDFLRALTKLAPPQEEEGELQDAEKGPGEDVPGMMCGVESLVCAVVYSCVGEEVCAYVRLPAARVCCACVWCMDLSGRFLVTVRRCSLCRPGVLMLRGAAAEDAGGDGNQPQIEKEWADVRGGSPFPTLTVGSLVWLPLFLVCSRCLLSACVWALHSHIQAHPVRAKRLTTRCRLPAAGRDLTPSCESAGR